MDTHPTAHQVHAQVSREYPGISLATVYRNLTTLAQAGTIRKIDLPDSAARFDHRLHPHYHLRCAGCNRLVDIDIPYAQALDAQAQAATDYQVWQHDIVFQGNCPHCCTTSSTTPKGM